MRSLMWSLAVALVAAVAAFVPTGSASPVRQGDVSVQPGQYSGTTSQGQPMALDVVADSPDFIDSWSFGFALTCAKTGRIANVGMAFAGFHVPIAADGTFSFNFLGLQFYFQWAGKFTSNTKARGNVLTRWAAMQDPTHSEVCSSGRVTWNATHSTPKGTSPDAYDMYFTITQGANGKVRIQQIK